MSLYVHPPREEVSLAEFETLAMRRIQLLKAIDAARAVNKRGAEFDALVKAACDKHMPFRPSARSECEREDEISHFVLRLAYCRTYVAVEQAAHTRAGRFYGADARFAARGVCTRA